MRKINAPYAKKFISIILSAVLLIQANIPAFSAGGSMSLMSSAEVLDAANKIDEAFLKGEEGNPYESALNAKKNAAIKKINTSQEKAKLASLKNTGKSRPPPNLFLSQDSSASNDMPAVSAKRSLSGPVKTIPQSAG